DVGGKGLEHGHGLDVQRHKVGDIVLVERLREISQDDIAIDRIGRCRHARAVTPDEFLFFFARAISLHLGGTLFDAETAIGIVGGLLVFLDEFVDVGAVVVLTEVVVYVLVVVVYGLIVLWYFVCQ